MEQRPLLLADAARGERRLAAEEDPAQPRAVLEHRTRAAEPCAEAAGGAARGGAPGGRVDARDQVVELRRDRAVKLVVPPPAVFVELARAALVETPAVGRASARVRLHAEPRDLGAQRRVRAAARVVAAEPSAERRSGNRGC